MSGKNVMRRLIEEVVNAGNIDIIDEIIDPKFVDHDVEYGEPLGTRESLKAFVRNIRRMMPDLRFDLQHETVDGQFIWQLHRASGTMLGPLLHHPPTGKRAEWIEMHLVRVNPDTGQIIEHWGAGHDQARDIQLGLQAPPTQAL